MNQYRNYTFVSENIQYIAFLVPVACLYSVALFFFNNMVAKVKAGTFWADCLIIRALKWIAGKTKSCFRYVKSHMSLTQKGVWAYIGITIVEIIFVAILAAGSMRGLLWVVIYIILKWLCIVGIVAYLIQTQELYKCAKEMAEGNLDRKADTSKMFWVFRAHGEHLNQIRDGMSKAVEARIKSEHLKTELITNVSHDIKTPLTSIINYVDRSAYSLYRFRKSDTKALAFILVCGLYVLAGSVCGGFAFWYYPSIRGSISGTLTVSMYVVYVCLICVPIYMQAKENFKIRKM